MRRAPRPGRAGTGAGGRGRRPPAVLAALITVLLTAGVVLVSQSGLGRERPTTVVASELPVPAVDGSGHGLATAAATIGPSVVTLNVVTTTESLEGSAIVLSSDGVLLTSNHLVADMAVNGGTLQVTLEDGRAMRAVVLGRAPDQDVAVLRIEASDLRPAILASSRGLRVGDQVLVTGSALGLHGSVTAGIVSALGREVSMDTPAPSEQDQQLYGVRPYLPERLVLSGLIQTDAAMNEGDSGGALTDASGRVVGLCAAFEAPHGSGSVGIGFAVPIDTAYAAVQRILAGR